MKQIIKRIVSFNENLFYTPILFIVFFVLSFCFESIDKVFLGYIKILTTPSVLLTDYFYIGGVGATFLNVSIMMGIFLFIIVIKRVNFTGPVFAGLLTVVGFSFFGKNILNSFPIIIGVLFYCFYKKIKYYNFLVIIMFSTGISPLVGYLMFGIINEWYFIIIGILVGIFVGFIFPILIGPSRTISNGYNLYNSGFALGIISLLFNGIFLFFNKQAPNINEIDNSHRDFILVLLLGISLFYILVSLKDYKSLLKKYYNLSKESGRLVSDFKGKYGVSVVAFNFGILMFVSTLIAWLSPNIILSGIIFGTIISSISFAGYGIHIKNVVYIWIGATIYILISKNYFENISLAMSFFYVTALSPIAGKYGVFAGISAGFLHMLIIPFMINFQGGFDLYNNGFCAGFVSFIVVNLIEGLKKEEGI